MEDALLGKFNKTNGIDLRSPDWTCDGISESARPFWTANAAYDCGAVMLGQFLVTVVQNHIVLGVGQRSRLAVVRYQ